MPYGQDLLIVDDDPAQRRILEETIKRLGFETKTASSGEQALQILDGPSAGRYRASCSSISSCTGSTAWRCSTSSNGKPGLPPIIVQTAHGSIDAAINAMRAGAVDFVVKPASPERLEVSIKSALKIEALAGEISRIKKKVRGHAHLRRPHHPRRRHGARHRARQARRRLQHPGADRGRIAASARS